MNRYSVIRKQSASYILYSLLPILLAIYPAFFHYANNSDIALFSDLGKLLALFAGIAIVLYGLFCVAGRGRAVQAANATAVFLLLFHTYGLAFKGLRTWDVIRVDYYAFLPLFILLGLQLAWLVGCLSTKLSARVWQGAIVIVGVLLAFNLVKVASIETRMSPAKSAQPAPTPAANMTANNYPDIYYFVYDEMVGFEAMRQYWHYDGVDSLAEFLKSNGFYVAEQSHSTTIETEYEIAQRLNFEAYPPYNRNDKGEYQADAGNGRVLRYLKSLGYTTVAFDENRSAFAFPAGAPMNVDYLYEQPSGAISSENFVSFDDFMLLVVDNTMLQPFVADIKLSSPLAETQQHRNMIFFTMDKISRLDDIPRPRFVYVHLLLPHLPLMFKADGSIVPQSGYHDWNNYLGNYVFTMSLIEKSIKNMLASADPARPPVIILQSDHGARNVDYGFGNLPNYPDTYKTLIVNAWYLPGCDPSVLTQDMNPINTFPIVFNCYFKADIPLIK